MNRNDYLIEASELLAKIDDPNIRIFDATIMFAMGISPEEAARMPTAHELYLQGHIPGAAFFNHADFSDTDSPYEYMLAPNEILAEKIGATGIGSHSEVIVYAANLLPTATRAWWLLRYAGVKNVRVLNGGLPAWKEAGGAVEQEPRSYPATAFEAHFNAQMFATKEEVQTAIDMEEVCIENALTQDWHDQEHIPSSSCLPLTDLTIEWNRFLPQDQLAARLTGAGQHKRIITYCGGGIAATLNAMAYLMVGFENVAVYDGSLYEWKGEGLPVANKK
jgi:thiosulfate/3-mercaptopyruvate sulfurtransferase